MPEIRKRRTKALTPAELLRIHSPIKNGLKIKDEDKPLEDYTKIMSKMYLGNIHAAQNKEFFQSKNIKAVLNCSKDIPHYFCKNPDIEYMRIAIDDSLKQVDFDKMYHYMPVIVEFIHKHIILEKHNIFIHCYAGRQRSCCAVAIYLMVKHNMTPAQACKFIMDKRKEAFHFGLSLNFETSLEKYDKDLQKLKKCKKQ